MIRTGIFLSAVVIAAMAAVSVYGLMQIPADAEIPRHWNYRGEYQTSPRDLVLLMGPLMALGLSALFAVLPVIDPRGENIRRSAGLYLTGWLGTVGIVAVVHGSLVLRAATGAEPDAPPGLPFFGICLLLILLGNFLPKSRSNFFIGVRTPWTLTSEHAWSVSNRLGGWLFVLTGLAAAVTAILRDMKIGYSVLITGVLATAVICVLVSWLAWRADGRPGR